jgi:membrane fusion protein, multidrug efflux system
MKNWSIGLLLLFILLFGSVIGFNGVKQQLIRTALRNLPEPTHPVTVQQVNWTEWHSALEAVGFIQPHRGVTVANQLPGTVQHILFEAGQAVQMGQPLVQLESTVERSQLAAAEARYLSVRTQYQRTRQLYRRRVVAQAALEQAQANYRALIAEIHSLREIIARRQISAPFSGVVGLNQVQLGQYLSPGTPIASVQDLSAMRVHFTLPQTAITQLQVQQPVALRVDALPAQSFQGVITALEPEITPLSGLLQLQADVTNRDHLLRAGMLSRITIPHSQPSQHLVLPQTAITFTMYGETVYALTTDEAGVLRVRQITLKLGERQGAFVQVLEGLKPGDSVVTSGQVRLSHGSRVKVVESDSTTADSLLEPLPKL